MNGMGAEVAEGREPGGAGGVGAETGGTGFFAGGEEIFVGGVGVIGSTNLRVVARSLSKSDVLLKMLFNGSVRYRPMRFGYRPVFRLRLPWVEACWHPLGSEVYETPSQIIDIASKIVGVPFSIPVA